MVTDQEFDDISKVLSDIIATQGGRTYLDTVFPGPEFSKSLSVMIGQTGSDEQVAAAAVKVCIHREWQDDGTCWMEKILIAIRGQMNLNGVGAVPGIDAIINRIHQKINVRDQIWYEHWILDERPFVDRGPFRDALAEVARVDGRPILRIEGEPRSGKSYSRELLEYVSLNSRWTFGVVNIEIKEGSGFAMNALRLAKLIVEQMDDTTVREQTEEDIQLLVIWIKKVAAAAKKQYWLFLDGFRFVHPQNSAHLLIQALAGSIATTAGYRQWLRLVLVDYDERLSQVDEDSSVAYDRTDPSRADENAILDCLRQACKKKTKPLDDEDLLKKARAIVASSQMDPPYFVGLNKLVKAARKLL